MFFCYPGLILDLAAIFFVLCILFLVLMVVLAVVVYKKANTGLVTKVPTNVSPGPLSGGNKGRGTHAHKRTTSAGSKQPLTADASRSLLLRTPLSGSSTLQMW